MEISYAYRIKPECLNKGENILSKRKIALSSNHKTFCIFADGFLVISDNESFDRVDIGLLEDENVTCISSVIRMPWIIAVGTSFGRIILVSPQSLSVIKSFYLHNGSEIFKFKEVFRNDGSSYIFAVIKPNIIVIIPSKDILELTTNQNFSITMTKVSIGEQKHISDCFAVFTEEEKVKLYTTGGNHILTVSYIQLTHPSSTIGKFASAINIFGKNFGDLPPSPVLSTLYDMEDGNRESYCISESPDNRYLAVSDKTGMIQIIDTKTDIFVKTKKNLPESQLAWYKAEDEKTLLIILSGPKNSICVLNYPEMDVADCITIEENGILLQTFDSKNNKGIAYVDKNGNIAILKPIQKYQKHHHHHHHEEHKEEEEEENRVTYTFAHPKIDISVAETNDLMQKIINRMCDEEVNTQSITNLIENVNDPIVAAEVISTIIKFSNATDDLIRNCISILNKSLDFVPTSPPTLRRQIENYLVNFKESTLIPEDEFGRYAALAEIWLSSTFIESEVIRIDDYPQTAITSWYANEYEHEALDKPNYLPMRLFISEPMKNFSILFASLRKNATHTDLIKIMMTVHPSSVDEFIQYFIFWCSTITPSHLALIQNVIVGLTKYNLKDTMMEMYNNIPDSASERNKALFMRIISE